VAVRYMRRVRFDAQSWPQLVGSMAAVDYGTRDRPAEPFPRARTYKPCSRALTTGTERAADSAPGRTLVNELADSRDGGRLFSPGQVYDVQLVQVSGGESVARG
jgi:hypothetical protein